MASDRKSRRIVSWLAACAFITTAGLVAMAAPESKAATFSGSISGRVFLDGGGDGLLDGSDAGVPGLEIKAYDSLGALVGTTTTYNGSATYVGKYDLFVRDSASSTVRVEFSTPVGYQSTLTTSSTAGSASSIRFVALRTTGIDYGIFVPADYCQKSESLAAVCINQGHKDVAARNTERSIGLTAFEPASTGDPKVAVNQTATAFTDIAKKVDTGATWGLGWQKTTRLLWNSAVIRRHAGLGPEGLGGVYVYNLTGTQVASFDLAADLGAGNLTLKAAGDDYSDAARDIVDEADPTNARAYDFLSRDIPGFSGVGTAGLGDLDISQDGNFLWVTNLYQRKVHRIAIGETAGVPTLGAVNSWSIANGHTCASNTGPLRGWGIDTNADGSIVLAAVCTNEAASPATKPLPGDGVILKLDPTKTADDAAAWTTLTTFGFDYPQNYDYCSTAPLTCTWKAWSSDWPALKLAAAFSPTQFWWTQPMIVDVEQLTDGSMVLGISDRFSYQMGNSNWMPEPTVTGITVSGWTAGDTLLLCKTATGWFRESNGRCEGVNVYQAQVPTGSVGVEFFKDDKGHPETTIGGLALGRGQVAVTAMDPASPFVNGIRWVSTVNGKQTNALNMSPAAQNPQDAGFGKSSGMGDVEALCDAAPLQIGNRVWYDDDRDGIQDPGEDPVVGVTVRLYDASQTLVGTAITNAWGEYYFSSNVTEAANGGGTPDEFGGGLAVNTAYTVVLDNPDDCAPGKPLEGFVLTYEDKTTTDGPPERDQLIDSDAVPAGADWCGSKTATVTVTPMSVGGVNHSYDIGFWKEGRVPSTPDSTDPDSSTPDSANPGSADTTVPGVDGAGSPTPTVGAASVSSTSPSSTIKVSVGDYVWWDLDRDGIQDANDIPIQGAILTITKVDGSPVTDVNGKPVTTTVTDANGKYTFDNLPPGQYTVSVKPPMNARTTKASAGKDVSKDSSTGSATSVVLTTDGQRDPTLDFGFYKPSVSVGNFVWRDVKGDGLQNISDKGLAGFKLTIKTAGGSAVKDVYGRPVRPITTKADGKYLFKELPPGRYEVFITYPRGWMPTTSNRPDRGRNSSTTSTLSNWLRAGESDLTLDFGVVSRPGELYRALPGTR